VCVWGGGGLQLCLAQTNPNPCVPTHTGTSLSLCIRLCGPPVLQVWADERARLERELASVSARMASVLERHNTADPEEHRAALARVAALEAALAEKEEALTALKATLAEKEEVRVGVLV
jgi:hypothetical protein